MSSVTKSGDGSSYYYYLKGCQTCTRLGPHWYADIFIDTHGGMLGVHMCQPAGREAVLCLVQCLMQMDAGEMSHSSSTQCSDSDDESELEPGSDAESDTKPDSDAKWDTTERNVAEVYKQLLPRPVGAHRTVMPATLWQAQMSGASHHLKKLQERAHF